MKKTKFLSYTLAGVFAFGGIQANVNAAMVETQALATEITLEEQRTEINALMARDDIARELSAMGVDAKDAQQRVASLSDAEVRMLHDKLDQLPAGSGALGAVLLVLLILILLDVVGATDIFPKI